MKLRWLIRKNKVTIEEVKAEYDLGGNTMKNVHKRLVDQDEPVLQYQDDVLCWNDVETVVEYRNE